MRGHRDNPSVNRYLKDKAMDRIDHALGRPADPLRETHRSYFAVGTDNDIAAAFRASPHWEEAPPSGINEDMRWFYVTDAGRKALAEHLKAIGDSTRRFVVNYWEYSDVVAAETPAKARYRKFLDVSDTWSELTFAEFQRNSRVRLAA
jgi:hypothetical protein